MTAFRMVVLGGAAAGLLSAPGLAQAGPELREKVCVLQVAGEDEPYVIEEGILELTESEERLSFRVDGRRQPEAVHCIRSSVVPAENDYKVVLSGLPLTLSTEAEEGGRTIVALELADDRFQLRVIQGELTEQELALAAQRIEGYSQRLASGGS